MYLVKKKYATLHKSVFYDSEDPKDLMQKCPYMPPSYTHEVYSSNITLCDTFEKSMVSSFSKRILHSCAWDSIHILSTVDDGAGRSLILSKYLIYTNISYLSKITFYLSIWSIRNELAEAKTTSFICYFHKIIIKGPFISVLNMVKF